MNNVLVNVFIMILNMLMYVLYMFLLGLLWNCICIVYEYVLNDISNVLLNDVLNDIRYVSIWFVYGFVIELIM